MPDKKEPQIKAKFKYKGHIQQVQINKQARDSEAVERLQLKVGEIMIEKDGRNVPHYTNVKIYCHDPNIKHSLNIKLAMNNPAGDCFTQFTSIEEFDKFLTALNNWRIHNNEGLMFLEHEENVLKARRHIHNKIIEILSDTDNELPQITIDGEIINNTYTNDILDKCYQCIDSMLTASTGKVISSNEKLLKKLANLLNPEDKTKVENYIKLRIGHMNITLDNY